MIASGSGLDPQISVQGANLQVLRIVAKRCISQNVVQHLIIEHTDGPLLGAFGPAAVNVLQLNVALDAATK